MAFIYHALIVLLLEKLLEESLKIIGNFILQLNEISTAKRTRNSKGYGCSQNRNRALTT